MNKMAYVGEIQDVKSANYLTFTLFLKIKIV